MRSHRARDFGIRQLAVGWLPLVRRHRCSGLDLDREVDRNIERNTSIFVIPVLVREAVVAREASGHFPDFAARRADAARVERVPRMTCLLYTSDAADE